jgi:ergothioneine biosynthesis protein EgtB
MRERLRAAWSRSDRLFGLLADEAWLKQPIPLRQPFLFYLGHLPAFAWNHVGRGLLRHPPFRAGFDRLFERGIDPVGVDAYVPRAAWPEREAVIEYRDRVRGKLVDALSDPGFPRVGLAVVSMVVEHELMHHETLLYMVQELDHSLKRRDPAWPALPDPGEPWPSRPVEVPAGEALLGAARGSLPFGWDNEFPEQRVHVAGFVIDDRPVTNADLLEFVRDGGYADPSLWREDDWAWRKRRCLQHPHSWVREGGGFRVRSLLEDVAFERAARWPAATSWAEAAAYAAWREARLPSEAEWQRAARGTPEGIERPWPWGDEEPTALRGSFHFRHGSPLPVGSHPAGSSAWGVLEMIGNGWEWTGTPFAPFPGFEPLPRYPGYSADFFDGGHFVLRGGSWATDEALLRPSFRNWFQPHYPYVFSKFRCVRPL